MLDPHIGVQTVLIGDDNASLVDDEDCRTYAAVPADELNESLIQRTVDKVIAAVQQFSFSHFFDADLLQVQPVKQLSA